MQPRAPSNVVSTTGPSAKEIAHNASLEAWVATRVEPLEESERRISALANLQRVCKEWIEYVMVTEFRMAKEDAKKVGGRIFSTGSFRYNVHSSGSDIDLVLVAPEKITRRHFFSSLVDRLSKESWVSDLIPTPDARTPIIAMKCEGIDIDLGFASVQRPTVPDSIDMLDDNILRGLDDKMVLSVNGVRVAQLLMDAVPNKAAFRALLRFVKVWSKNRGIYSTKFAFPNGIGWAIMCARVSQAYPNLNAAGLIVRFFKFYASWWSPEPTNENPNRFIALYPREPKQIIPGVDKVWDPQTNMRDAGALFPVLTPAYPAMNSCSNVTRTTLKILCEEFKRGAELCAQLIERDPPPTPYGIWSELLQPYPLFTSFTHFLHMTVSTTTAESYTRWVESIEAMCRFIWVDHYSKGKKGVALENFPHVRLRTISNRFEEPNQKAYLDFLREQEKAARNAAQALKIGTMVGVAEGNAASPGRVRGKVPLPDGITVPELFTGHFFFGLEMKPAPPGHPPNKKVDFTGMVKNFKELCQELKSEYKAGETKLPEMNIVDRSKIPKWVLEATGVKEAPAAQSEQQDTLGAAQKTEDISAASAKSQVESVAAEESRKRPRDETEDPQTVKEPTGSTSVAAEPPPASTSADAALGLDF